MIAIIVAVAENGVIGGENRLLWHISEDLKHFKAVTTGHPVVMGRKTYESLGRPLPGRRNVVVTRQNISIEGATWCIRSTRRWRFSARKRRSSSSGGAQIYAQALPLCDEFYLTRVFHAYQGDTCFPRWDEREWEIIDSESFASGKEFPYPFAFEHYRRRK